MIPDQIGKSFRHHVDTRIRPFADLLDRDSKAIRKSLTQLFSSLAIEDSQDQITLSTVELRYLFGSSGCLGFVCLQHLAAVKRIATAPGWILQHPGLWRRIRRGEVFCGLATTHLANLKGASVQAERTSGGFILNGKASWVTGFSIFETFIVGFEFGESIGYAMLPFTAGERTEGGSVAIEPILLSVFNGSSSVQLSLKDVYVSDEHLVSVRAKGGSFGRTRSDLYLPELGIAIAALNYVEQKINNSRKPMIDEARAALESLRRSVAKLLNTDAENLDIDRAASDAISVIQNSIRLAAIVCGSESILSDSVIARWQREILLLDLTLQSSATVRHKFANLGRLKTDFV